MICEGEAVSEIDDVSLTSGDGDGESGVVAVQRGGVAGVAWRGAAPE